MNYYSNSLSRQKIIKENNLIVENFEDYYDANEESYETIQKTLNNKKYSDEFGNMILNTLFIISRYWSLYYPSKYS